MMKNKVLQNFKSPGAIIGLIFLLFFIFVAVFAPLLAPHDPQKIFEGQYQVPAMWNGGSTAHIFGTDDIGRDLLSRLIFGARVSLAVGFTVVTLSLIAGVLLGVLAGFYEGWVESLIMRFTDILMALPSVLLAIVIVSILGPSLRNGIIAVAIVYLPNYIRVVRTSVLAEKKKPYMDAAICFGSSSYRQILLHILPNCLAPIIVLASLGFSEGILNVAALGFLGLGAQPPTPEWGVMLADARSYIESNSNLVTLPGVCILTVVIAFNLLGDGLRDALDPKLRGRG